MALFNTEDKERAAIYVAAIPESYARTALFCKSRNDELDAIKNPTVFAEKYFAWRLLEHAARDFLGIDAASVEFTKLDTSKWVCRDFHFSLSHSEGAVAVAVCKEYPVGIDIQAAKPISERLAKKVLTDAEYEQYLTLSKEARGELALHAWCACEALYKLHGNLPFSEIKGIESRQAAHYSLTLSGKEYFIAAAIAHAIPPDEPRLVTL